MSGGNNHSWLAGCLAVFLLPQPHLQDREVLEGFAIRNTREVKEFFLDAEEHFKQQRWEHGLKVLQKIIDERPNDLILADDPEESLFYQSVYTGASFAAENRIRGLPVEARNLYQTIYGSLARANLDAGRAKNDPAILEKVVQRYRMTQEGTEALLILGDLALEKGQILEAANHYRLALQQNEHDYDVRAAVRLGIVYRTLGDRTALRDLMQIFSNQELAVDANKSLLLSLEEWWQATPPSARQPRDFAGWAAHHTKNLEPEPTGFEAVAWQYPGAEEELRKPFQDRGRGFPSPTYHLHPTIYENTVLLTDSISTFAIDLFSGRKLWEFAGAADWERISENKKSEFYQGINPNNKVAGAGAKNIFVVPLQVPLKLHGNESIQGISIRTIIPTRRLFAFDIATGKLLWSHWNPGHAMLGIGEFADQSSVAGPPIIAGEHVYVPVYKREGKIDYYIACFDLRSGELLWKTLLVSGQLELNMFGRQIQEFAGSPILLHNGKLYFSTNLGVIACVEGSDGTVRWISRYDSLPMPKATGFHRHPRNVFWANQPPAFYADTLFITPLDSADLYAVNMENGAILQPRISYNFQGNQFLHMLGVAEDKLILYGAKLCALDVRNDQGRQRFKILWENNVLESETQDPRHLPRGIVTERSVLLPTPAGIKAFALNDGHAEPGWISWEHASIDMGNLLLEDGILIAQSDYSLQARFDWKKLLRKARYQASTKNMEALEKLGRLLRRYGDFLLRESPQNQAESIQAFLESSKILEEMLAQGNRSAAHELTDLYLSIADIYADRGSVIEAESFYNQALERTPGHEERLYCLLRLVKFLEKYGSRERLLKNLETLQEEYASETSFLAEYGNIPIGLYVLLQKYNLEKKTSNPSSALTILQTILEKYGNENLSSDLAATFAKTEIHRLLEEFGREIYAPFESRAQQMLDQALASQDETELFDLIRLFPNSQAVNQAYLILGDLFLAKNDVPTLASLCRSHWQANPHTPSAMALLRRLAQAFANIGNHKLEQAMLRFLRNNYGETVSDFPPDQNNKYAALWHPQELPPLPPGPTTPISLGKRMRLAFHSMSLQRPYGDNPSLRGYFLIEMDGSLGCYQVSQGLESPVWKIRLDQEDHNPILALHDNYLLVAAGSSIQGLDLTTGEQIWLHSLANPLREAFYRDGLLIYTFEDREGFITCSALDIVQGVTLWANPMKSEFVPTMIVGESYVALRPQGIQETMIPVYNLFTGKLVRSIEPPHLIKINALALAESHLLLAYPPLPNEPDGRENFSSVLYGYSLNQSTDPWKVTLPRDLDVHSFLQHRDKLFLYLNSQGQSSADDGAIYEVLPSQQKIALFKNLPKDVRIPGLFADYNNQISDGKLILYHEDTKGFVRANLLDFDLREIIWKRSLPLPIRDIDSSDGVSLLPAFTEKLVALPIASLRSDKEGQVELFILDRRTGETVDNNFLLGELKREYEFQVLAVGESLIAQMGYEVREYQSKQE